MTITFFKIVKDNEGKLKKTLEDNAIFSDYKENEILQEMRTYLSNSKVGMAHVEVDL